MRSFVLVIAIALAGCGGADSSSDDMSMCSSQCPSPCASGTVCVTGDNFEATCLAPCDTNDDCTGGDVCVILDPSTRPIGNYCVSPTRPRFCAPCPTPQSIGCDGDVRESPSLITCGIMRQRCPSECADGGMPHNACP